jgi:AraC-like DNA-binding protein
VHFDWYPRPVSRRPSTLWLFAPTPVQPDWLIPHPSGLPDLPLLASFAHEQDVVEALVIRLDRNWHSSSRVARLACRGILLELLIRILVPTEPTEPADRNARLANAARQLIEQNLSSTIPLVQLLAPLHYSQAHLSRAFKATFGISPGRYRQYLRLELAKSRLRKSEHNIAEIARMCGFEDPGHFSRVFKSATGVSPRDFR